MNYVNFNNFQPSSANTFSREDARVAILMVETKNPKAAEKMVANLDETNNQLKDIIALVENKLAILDALKVAKANNELKALNEAYETAKAENLESFEFNGQTFKVINESKEEQVEEKFRYTEDDINTLYGFYGTLETNFKKKDVERMYTEGVDGLMKAYKISEKVAIAILDSKVGRHMADMIYSKIATDAVDALAKYFGSGARVWNYITSMVRLEESLDLSIEINEKEYSEEERKEMAKNGEALPDGSFPIADKTDLENAIQAYGRASNQSAAAKHIVKRAKSLGLEDMIPTTADFQKSLNEAGDHEVGMANGQLADIVKNAQELMSKIGTTEKDIPGWIQDHISQAQNYINQANSNYHELEESVIDEAYDWGTYNTPEGSAVAKVIDKAYNKFSSEVSKAFNAFKTTVKDYSTGSKRELGDKSGFNDSEGQSSIAYGIRTILNNVFEINTQHIYVNADWMYESRDTEVNETVKSASPNDVIIIDLDMAWDDSNKEEDKAAKAAFKKYKIKVNGTGEPGTYEVTGKKKDILAYLQSEFYEMDDEDIKEFYPELLESYGSGMGLSKVQTKKVAETLAKAISKNDGVNCTVNAKTLEEDSFDLDIDGELGAAGSYNIYDDGSVVNHAVTPNEIYGNYKSTVEEFIRGLKKPIYESVTTNEAKEIEVSLRYARLANDVFDDMYRRLGKKTSTNTFKMNSDDLADDFTQSLLDAGIPQEEIYEGWRPMTDEEKAEKQRKDQQLKRLRAADKKSADSKRLRDLQTKMHQDRLKKSNK